MSTTRRHLILTGAAAGLLIARPLGALAALMPTPRQSEGPFYPDILPGDMDNDLVRIEGMAREAGGEILRLAGRVLHTDGRPLEGAVVEIWQCDAEGQYIHSRDGGPGGLDRYFQGIGRVAVDADGAYSFRTIRPVAYTGRTPHIHANVYAPNGRRLTTQVYVSGEPTNANDGLYRRLSSDEQQRVTMTLTPGTSGFDWFGDFDFVVG
jgi:protocatechuate 3,4-dioxygenase, beta subunit